jgi:hypothetical protein
MFTGFDSGADLAKMKVGRSTDINDIDIGATDRSFEISEEFWDCVFFGQSASALGIDVTDGGNFKEVRGGTKSSDMLCTDTGTDNDDSKRVSHLDRGKRWDTTTALLS